LGAITEKSKKPSPTFWAENCFALGGQSFKHIYSCNFLCEVMGSSDQPVSYGCKLVDTLTLGANVLAAM